MTCRGPLPLLRARTASSSTANPAFLNLRVKAASGAADQTEWVSQIRTVTTLVPPYQLQEDLHPSYWGQLALRNCLRQAYVQSRGGTCRSEGGMDGAEPNVALD